MTHRRLLPGLLAAALTSSGCFRYVEVAPAVVPAGNEVRVELTRVGFAALPEIPSYPGPDLTGRLVSADAAALRLSVPVAIRRDGLLTQTVEQQVTVPTSSIVQVEQRVIDRKKTGLAIAAGVGTLGAIFLGFRAGRNNGAPEQGSDNGEVEAGSRLLAPLIHLRIPGLP